ncbi:MAG: SMI1/KNR4 family protein, partial [Pseudomonadota bacterium]
DPLRPEQFWANSHVSASRYATDKDWDDASQRFGHVLPDAFKHIFGIIDGGKLAWPYHEKLGVGKDGTNTSLFPDRAFHFGQDLPGIDCWVSLADLSDRIDFQGETPYRDIHAGSENLIVMTASHDTALMLDYRRDETGIVVFCTDLTDASCFVDLGTPSAFLSGLRRPPDTLYYGRPLSDPRLSPMLADISNFWMEGSDIKSLSEHGLARLNERLGCELPDQMARFLKQQNGGQPRFRFMPPIGDKKNYYGRPESDPTQTEWIDVFPNGIWPVEHWQKFDDFRMSKGIALTQDTVADLVAEPHHCNDRDCRIEFTERLFVISADDENAITLLDLSNEDGLHRAYMSRLRYQAKSDTFEFETSPNYITNVFSGAFLMLRARWDDIK